MDDERTFTPSEILEYCSKKWFDNPAGISALDLAKHLQITNEVAMRIFESFNELEYGTLNKNVKLYSIHFDPKSVPKTLASKEEITHIFSRLQEYWLLIMKNLACTGKISLSIKNV